MSPRMGRLGVGWDGGEREREERRGFSNPLYILGMTSVCQEEEEQQKQPEHEIVVF